MLTIAEAYPETTKTKEQAQAYVDSILPLVKNNVDKFKEVASEINTDGSKANEGEVGWTKVSTFNPDAFDPDYADFIFSNELSRGASNTAMVSIPFLIFR